MGEFGWYYLNYKYWGFEVLKWLFWKWKVELKGMYLGNIIELMLGRVDVKI